MKKAFPNTFLGVAIGWRKRGKTGLNYKGNDIYGVINCSLCKTRANVGIERNERFLYCQKCLVKLLEEKK